MSKLPSALERELSGLKPRSLDNTFLDRLVACAEGTDTVVSQSDESLAESLGEIRPAALTISANDKLLAEIGDTPFHVDEKIVLFNKSNRNTPVAKRSNILRFHLPAAAAVALLGTLAAFMVPSGNAPANGTAGVSPAEQPTFPTASPSALSNYAPASFGRNLSDTRDEGVIWENNIQPHRVMRFTYMDKVTLKNDKGESIEVEQPKFEYVVIPEKID